jgi:hypothetical protein
LVLATVQSAILVWQPVVASRHKQAAAISLIGRFIA